MGGATVAYGPVAFQNSDEVGSVLSKRPKVFFIAPQLLFQPLALGDAADDPRKHQPPLRWERDVSHFDRELGAVRAHRRPFDPPAGHTALASADSIRQALSIPLAQRRRDNEVEDLSAQRLGAAVTEHLLRRPVELDYLALIVCDEDGIEGRLQYLGYERPAPGRCLFGLLALGEVAGATEQRGYLGGREGEHLLVARAEFCTSRFLREVDNGQHLASVADGCAEEGLHRWVVRRKAKGARMLRQVCQPQGLLCPVKPPQEAQALGRVPDAVPFFWRNTMGDELLDASGGVKHCQRSIASAGQLTSGISNFLEHRRQIRSGRYPATKTIKQREIALEAALLRSKGPKLFVFSSRGA